jgi:diadenosine tetraphosphatase ApaH/serine/threonine PP2A family protein phosphatase
VRYLVLTDLHANLHALDAVLADARAIGYDQVLVLGDLVGYGADPGPVIDRTFELAPTAVIRGNHDKVCAGLEPATLFNDVARRSIEWTAGVLTAAQLQTLVELPQGPRLVTAGLEICHGTPFDEDHYVFDGDDAAQAIDAASGRICLFGHTHLPAVYTTSDDQAVGGEDLLEDELRLPKAGPALINVGSVGQPRDGDSRAAYGLLDLETQTIRMRRVPYDIQGAQRKILEAGLPTWLAMRLERGQ